jgi:predicted dehydrogenase
MGSRTTRRTFLGQQAGLAAGVIATSTVPYFFTSSARAQDPNATSKNDRPILGAIATGDRWRGGVGPNAMAFGDFAMVCDVDAKNLAEGQQLVEMRQGKKPEGVDDYRRILDRKDIEVVTIVSPDHWHTKMAIEAMQAGKDVYCEKPLTLTLDDGKAIIKTMEQTGRVFQVGTQQRSEFGLMFLKAVAIARLGRLGKISSVQCAIGPAPTSGPIPKVAPPTELNWDRWLGPAPAADYRYLAVEGERYGHSRCHYEFRWWYEYSGGKMTDWGAHHVDIAQWAIGMDRTGPTKITPKLAKFPVPFDANGNPTDDSQYNTPTEFLVECEFADGILMTIRHDTDNGVLIEGSEGRIFVNRGKLAGKAVEDLEKNPIPEEELIKLTKGLKVDGGDNSHMKNFFECIKTRQVPNSDVYTHHRAMSTCHLANIALRLNRPLTFDPVKEQIVGDDQALAMQSRTPRKGFEIGA